MNENIKSILIKMTLTIPALAVGILSAIFIILKPVIELWNPKPILTPTPELLEEEKEEKRTFA